MAPLNRALVPPSPDADLPVLAATVARSAATKPGAEELLDRAYALDPENEAVLAFSSGAHRHR